MFELCLILSVDDAKLSVDELQFISKQLPTADEVNRLKDYGDTSKLAIADRYFCEVLRFLTRINNMLMVNK